MKKIGIDVSELIRQDAGTGIQRVTRNVSKNLLKLSLEESKKDIPEFEYTVASGSHSTEGFYDVNLMIYQMIKNKDNTMTKEIIESTKINIGEFDIYFFLDFQIDIFLKNINYLKEIKTYYKTKYVYFIHDLLPLNFTLGFPKHLNEKFKHFLINAIDICDAFICNSKATMDDLESFIKVYNPKRLKETELFYVHLSGELDGTNNTKGYPDNYEELLNKLKDKPTFIYVSTIEPRKGHEDLVKAFIYLIEKGYDINLVLVGKVGWMIQHVATFVKEMSKKYSNNIHYLNYVSDEFLDVLYKHSTALINPSQGEGFGLSVVEAMNRNLHIICRDIPIFREITENKAYFFPKNSTYFDIANTVKKFLEDYKNNKLRKVNYKLTNRTWYDVSKEIHDILMKIK